MYLTEKMGGNRDYSNFCLWNLQASILQLITWHTFHQRAVNPYLFHLSQYLALSVYCLSLTSVSLLWVISASTQIQCSISGLHIRKWFLHTVFVTIYDIVICFPHYKTDCRICDDSVFASQLSCCSFPFSVQSVPATLLPATLMCPYSQVDSLFFFYYLLYVYVCISMYKYIERYNLLSLFLLFVCI